MIRLAPGEIVELSAATDSYSLRLSLKTANGERICRLPITKGVSYYLRCSQETILSIDGANVRTLGHGIKALFIWLYVCFVQRLYRLKPLALGFGVLALGRANGKKSALKLAKDLKILRLLGLHLSFEDTQMGRFICDGVGGFDHKNGLSLISLNAKLCIVIHLYYTDVWPDFLALLQGLECHTRLIITLPPHEKAFGDTLKAFMPHAKIMPIDNFGRDLGPFMVLHEQGAFKECDLILKLHGKKSYRDQRPTLLGDLWRRQTLWDLLSPERFRINCDRFLSDHKLGILGPSNLRVPNEKFSDHDAWGSNQSLTLKWAQKMNEKAQKALDYELNYFSGTMFFIRPAVLEPFLGLGLNMPATYQPEQGAIDANLEHALERLFCHAARLENLEVGTTNSPPVKINPCEA